MISALSERAGTGKGGKMKNLLLITTGGTIACQNSAAYRTPKEGAELLLKKSGIPAGVNADTVSPFCLDSTNMTPKNWTETARIIHDNYGKYDGFVITHGTDTLGYAAGLLSCLIQNSAKPIILTGSMLPMEANGSDAPANLYDALLAACCEDLHGVNVVFHHKIIDGRSAVKLHTQSTDAFGTINRALAGMVDNGGVNLAGKTVCSGEPRFYFEADNRVMTIKLTPGAPPPAVNDGIKAVVIECFGTGGLPEYGDGAYKEWLSALIGRGVYVIMSTQAVYGGSDLSAYLVGMGLSERYSVIDAGKKSSEYAVTRAMWALANSADLDGFKKLFMEDWHAGGAEKTGLRGKSTPSKT